MSLKMLQLYDFSIEILMVVGYDTKGQNSGLERAV